jgi:N-acetylmuramic acid 6-phosphate etherase
VLEQLLTEQRNPRSERIDTLSTEDMLRVINDEDRKVAVAVSDAIPQIARAVDGITAALGSGGRLFYIGAGTSGRLGVLDASECPPTFSVPPSLVQGIMAGGESALSRATEASEDDPASGVRDLMGRGFDKRDVLAGIAASGRTPYVLGAIQKARELGAVTIGISCTSNSQLSAAVDIPIEILTGPEIVTGSTRMKAGTGTKLVLNMLTTGAMIRLGNVYGNLMVNVQPRNEKLRDRARRIVRDAAGVNDQQAAELLSEAGSVKTAIVMGKKGVDREAAESLLLRANGVIGKALEF